MTETASTDRESLRVTILDLLANRDAGKSICPSEAARAIAGQNEKEWRKLMKPIRAVAVEMALSGEIEILRKRRKVDPEDFRGIYRLALPQIEAVEKVPETEPDRTPVPRRDTSDRGRPDD